MFELIQNTSWRGDCSAGFNIKLGKNYTVGEFINDILSTRLNEWGYIGIENPDVRSIFGYPVCEYRYGKLTTTPLPDDILAKKIKEAKADGGWSRMDYIIKLKD